MAIDWENLFKIRIANSDDSFQHHEIVKLLLVIKIIKKYGRRIDIIRLYTELKLENGLKPDVYFEDTKNKAVYIYEIQKEYTKEWLEEKTKQYNNYEIPFTNSVNFIPINLNELSKNIEELNLELEKYIF
jgi:hypothetical protein